jgi:hypothetical protein
MQQLIEGVLAIGAGIAPDDRAGRHGKRLAGTVDALAVALHFQLLQVGRQQLQGLAVGQHGGTAGAEEVGVPQAEQGQGQRQVVGGGGG